MAKVVQQAWGEASAVTESMATSLMPTAISVRSIVCVQEASLTLTGWTGAVVDGVRLCSGGRLVDAILDCPDRVNEDDVQALSDFARRRLAPAVSERRSPAGEPALRSVAALTAPATTNEPRARGVVGG